jgi:histidinol-phosphate aminotransferase
MSRFWSDHVSTLSPYVPGEQPRIDNLLKLNTNEHPYGPSPRALEAIRDAVDDTLRLYPDTGSSALCEAIAALHGIGADQVILGNGSDEVLAHVFNGLFRHAGRPLLMPDVTYSFYRTYCKMYDIAYELVPLADDFSINIADYTRPREQQPAGIIFANPNAPTGRAMPLEGVRAIAQAHPDTVVVVDEAYVDFGAESAVALLDQHDNVVVIHTLSKSRALAGLRVGYAMASREIIQGLVRIKDSFNSYPMDRLAQAGALAALQDTGHFETSRRAIMASRDDLASKLETLDFEVLPSRTNFLFVRHAEHDALKISRALRAEGILVRHFTAPRIDQFLRITVGTPEQCTRLCNTLAEILLKTY